MAIKTLYKGKIENGVFKPFEPEKLKASFKKYKDGTEVWLWHQKEQKPRSLKENAYMWSVVMHMFSEETGETPERCYNALLLKFSRINEHTVMESIKTSSEMTTVEMEEFLEKCRRYGAELGYDIPLPNEVDYINGEYYYAGTTRPICRARQEESNP